MNIAALAAALKGDTVNALVASTPGGIEAQEKAGQTTFVAGDMLPKEISGATREQLVALGFIFGDDLDNLFVVAKLPADWKKQATDHDMYSIIIDEQGRERASIFYKAAFYDRRTDMRMTRRYAYDVQPVGGWGAVATEGGEWVCIVTDCDKEIWRSAILEPEPEYSGKPQEADKRQAWLDWSTKKDVLGEQGQQYLNEHYPNWRNPLAYW